MHRQGNMKTYHVFNVVLDPQDNAKLETIAHQHKSKVAAIRYLVNKEYNLLMKTLGKIEST